MKFIVRIAIVIFTLLTSTNVSALDFEVTRVIKIGEGTWSITPGLVKFSPNSELISYFNKSRLMISDLDGNSREVSTVQGRLIKYEWLSDSQIVLLEYERLVPPQSLRRLVLIDIRNESREPIAEYVRHSKNQNNLQDQFEGLFRTRSGVVYTKSASSSEHLFVSSTGKLQPRAPESSAQKQIQERVFIWGRDGLYSKSVNTGDSIRVGPRPTPNALLPPVWDPEMKYAMNGGTILRIKDTTFIVLDTLLGAPPETTSRCGIELPSLNPLYHEALFNMVCYGSSSSNLHEPDIEIDHVGLFDFATNKITILDTLIGIKNCAAPSYSHDGKSIVVLADGSVYVIQREINQ